jgi:hypothetical protein
MKPVADEQQVVREMARRILKGESLRSVSLDMNARRIKTSYGNDWTPTAIRDLLVSPHLAGLRIHKGEIVGDALWKPVFDRDTHEKLKRTVRGPSKSGRGKPPESLLARLVKCGNCGRNLWHARVNGKDAYRCADKSLGGCNGCTIVAEPVEQLVTDAVLHRIDSPAVARARASKPKPGVVPVDIGEIETELEELAADYGNRRITRREWMAAREPLEKLRDLALAEIAQEADTAALAVFKKDDDVASTWKKLDLDRRRAVLAALIESVTIGEARRGLNRFDADRVNIKWRF